MVNRPLTLKQTVFIDRLFTNGFNATQAYKAAYPGCNGGHNRLGARLMTNDVIKQEIARRRAETVVKMDYSLDTQRKKLDLAYEIARKQGNPAGMTTAVKEQNAVSGHHIQTVLTDPAQAQELTEAERMMGEELIRLRRRLKYGVVDALPSGSAAGQPEAEREPVEDNGQGLRMDRGGP